MAGRTKAGEEVLRYELPRPLRRADEDGKWAWRRADVWHLKSLLEVRLPPSIFLPFPPLPSHSPVGRLSSLLSSPSSSLPFLAHLPYFLTNSHCNAGLVIKTFCASVSSSVKWVYILLLFRVEGLRGEVMKESVCHSMMLYKLTHHYYYFILGVPM